MTLKRIASTTLALSLAIVPAGRAMADGDALVGGIVGGIIGGVIVNEANKNRAKRSGGTTTRSSSGVSSAQRNSNREVQTALNYFGFPVGTPDGAIGPRSRAAIAEYQITMGFPGTGQLNDFERDILVSSYYRAQAGGATTASLIASNPQGAKGVLIAWKNERLGIGAPAAPGTVAAGTAAAGTLAAAGTDAAVGTVATAGTVGVAAAAPDATGSAALPSFTAPTPEPEPTPEPAAAPALPSFMGQAQVQQVSLASHCSKVSLVTNSNGGFVTQVTMTDPAFALSEQFCLARTYGMAQGEELMAKVQGFTPAQVAEQCLAFQPVLSPYVQTISLKSRDEVLADVSKFVVSSGMQPAQLAGTAKTCLGVGYTTDNSALAIGSALLLAAVGEKAYGELIGHHLVSGIGTASRPDLALAWFEGALGDSDSGVTQVFAPGMTDRTGLIRMAAYAVAGQPLPGGAVPEAAPEVEPTALEITPAPADQGLKIPSIKLPFIGGATKSP